MQRRYMKWQSSEGKGEVALKESVCEENNETESEWERESPVYGEDISQVEVYRQGRERLNTI